MIDLHIHSRASDGTLTPRQIVELAIERNLQAIALTDHDTIDGIKEFLLGAANESEIKLIPGVEVSSIFNKRELHLVGLFIDSANRQLLDMLEQIRVDREYRNLIITERVCDMGYQISYDEVMAEAGGAVVGRPHFAGVLMRKYDFSSRQAVFDACLKRGTRGYVPRKLPHPRQVIETIHAAGGCVVWGHPIYRDKGERSFMRRVLRELVPVGLDAVEAYYSSFSSAQEATVKELAAEFNLALSGGSDFHGANIPDIELGSGYGELNVPDQLLTELEKRARRG